MKRLKSVLLALAALAAASTSSLADVTVLGWPGGPEEAGLRKAAEAYNGTAAADDKVKLIFFNREGFWDKLQADLAAGSTEFDINLLATYAIGKYAPFMEPITLPASAKDVFGEKTLTTMQYDGKQYGVPTDLSMHFMYYRKDLIEKLLTDKDWQAKYAEISEKYLGKKLTPVDPDKWTWDDWAATALFFTKAVNPESPVRYGTVLQMKNLLFNMMVFGSLPRSYGANWTDASGNVTVDSPAYRTALELYKKLYDAGATPKDSLSYEFAETNAALGSGQAATALQWNAAAADLNDATKSPAIAGKIEAVAPPAGPDGRFTHIHGLGFGLNKASTHKDSALKFLDWLATADAMEIYAKAGGSPAVSDAITAKLPERPDLAKLGAFANAYGFVMNGATSANALSVYEAQAKAFTGYWAGTLTLDAALAQAQADMTKLLK
ncbi:extracellular solute-binding protein [Kaistia dalseonensis]|uniref:Multiple sugar transport system substrate-binding protein n=1 Tax=Kaistia dalseonensis TaxID=410840 RepID=A0ABU0H4Z7_9HYPH|nr:extracellular solute-binding protein [Kaistia dalseonensis]MCX5494791.1 extracellular solute-binding protein [Kaistia dalseonensis]MDQ0437372.1 multiple sugar transport system substrate-binding protein [Kaistia dalseonensis]